MRDPRRRAALALAVIACAVGCSEGDTRAPSTHRASTTAQAPATAPSSPAGAPELDASDLDASDLDRLRALAYVDAPELGDRPTGVVRYDRDRAQPGLNYATSAMTCSSRLFDMDGEVIRRWQWRPCYRWDNSVLREDGSIVVVHRGPGADAGVPEGRSLLALDWNGDELWRHELATHHDVAVVGDDEALTLTFTTGPDPAIHPELPVRDDRIVRVRGGRVETLASLTALARAAGLPLGEVRPSKRGDERVIDLFHANAIDRLGPTRVLVTSRHQDLVMELSLDPPRVLWSFGPGVLSGPHDATLLDDGHVLVFDNGLARERSRVVEVDRATGAIVWQHDGGEAAPFYTRSRGAAQRLANGNTLITVSDEAFAFEVTPDGERVWEYHNPERTEDGRGVSLVRMRRVRAASGDATDAAPPFLPSD